MILKYGQIVDGSNKQIYLGRFNTAGEAFISYKTFKEDIIKQIANEYQKSIPQKLYDAMYKYKVEITDQEMYNKKN